MKRIIAICFASLLLISNVGLTYAMHYCGGKVVKNQLTIIGNSQLDCGMAMDDQSCANHHDSNNVRNQCCSNEIIHLTIDGDFESPLVSERKSDITDFALFSNYTFTQIATYTESTVYGLYQPPAIDCDTPVMIQCFLI